jgi:hypothetical protein
MKDKRENKEEEEEVGIFLRNRKGTGNSKREK